MPKAARRVTIRPAWRLLMESGVEALIEVIFFSILRRNPVSSAATRTLLGMTAIITTQSPRRQKPTDSVRY